MRLQNLGADLIAYVQSYYTRHLILTGRNKKEVHFPLIKGCVTFFRAKRQYVHQKIVEHDRLQVYQR